MNIFFENIDTEEKAYFLGWMISDGYVVKPINKSYVVGIDIHIKDKYILEKFREAINLDEPSSIVDIVKGGNSSKRNIAYQSRFSFRSNKVASDLSKYGVVQRKSHVIRFPLGIEENFIRHIIRGIFDGDGCISGQIISFSGNKNMMIDIRNILHKSIGVPYNMVTNNGGCFYFSFSAKKDVKNFYHYIYNNSTVFLTRKKERFENLDFIKQHTLS